MADRPGAEVRPSWPSKRRRMVRSSRPRPGRYRGHAVEAFSYRRASSRWARRQLSGLRWYAQDELATSTGVVILQHLRIVKKASVALDIFCADTHVAASIQKAA